MIERVGQQPLSTVHSQRQETSFPGVSFDAALRQQMQAQEGQVSFSKHAMFGGKSAGQGRYQYPGLGQQFGIHHQCAQQPGDYHHVPG